MSFRSLIVLLLGGNIISQETKEIFLQNHKIYTLRII
jgi:hypothetical protein